MSGIKLYAHPQSPPARTVAITLDALKVDHEYVYLDLFKGDGRKPEYLKINPQHNVPCLQDGDVVTNESVAIILYLAEKFNANAPELYPLNDLKAKTKVNQRLLFNSNVLWDAMMKCFIPIAFRGAKEIEASALEKLKEVLGWLTDYLEPTGYVAGTPGPTLADFATLAMVTTLFEGLGEDVAKAADWPKIVEWKDRMKGKVPDYEKANGKGIEVFKTFWAGKRPQ